MVFKSFSFDLGNSRKITTDIIFRSKITEFRSKSPKFWSEFIGISFFEFEFTFHSELANFSEISAEISFPAVGRIRKKNEKVNPDGGLYSWDSTFNYVARDDTGKDRTQQKCTVHGVHGRMIDPGTES